MENKLIIAGFGGQGVMLTGQLLGYGACKKGNNALFLPQYGPEQRGGTASCTVMISNEDIGAPVVDKVDDLMVFNQPSLEKFIDRLKTGGTLFVNTSLCNENVNRDDIEIIGLPIDEMAMELGNKKVSNIIMLGAYISKTNTFTEEEMIETIKVKLAKKPQLLEVNEKAIRLGYGKVSYASL